MKRLVIAIVLVLVLVLVMTASLFVGCRDVRKDSLRDNITVESKCERCK